MKHFAMILLASSLFTACMTEADKALWVEAKDVFSSDGTLVSSAVAEIKDASKQDEVAEQDKAPAEEEAPGETPKPVEATTGR